MSPTQKPDFEKMPLKTVFLTSFPMDIRLGSGVVRMIQGFHEAFTELGCQSTIFSPSFYEDNNKRLALSRLQYNRQLAKKNLSEYDLIIGSDFDGFAIRLPKKMPFIALNGGLLADIIRFEQGQSARILNLLANREKLNLGRAKLVIVPSRYSALKVQELYKIDTAKIRIVPLGIDYQNWKIELERASVFRNDHYNILCVARQYARKGIKDLLHAFAIIKSKKNSSRLTIVGDGPQAENNKKLARRLNIARSVDFCGDITERSQIAAFYKNADIFCLPSYHETFGLVFLEAMAAGLPVVSYRTTAIPEVVDEEFGILCEPGNIEHLANKLLFLMDQKRLVSKLGQKGNKVVQKMTWMQAGKKLLSIIKNQLVDFN